MRFPLGKKFAFTVFDDTDYATVPNVKPVYDLLYDCGMRTTKSVWVFPSRGPFAGSSLQDDEYLCFILELRDRGFEIGLHSVGDGRFTRQEIRAGLDQFRAEIGYYPQVHTNHSFNPDNLYWRNKRFEWPVSLFYSLLCGKAACGGELRNTDVFWGDYAKEYVRYIRNLTFNDINTLASDPRTPHSVERTSEFTNLWFSSSDGDTVKEFTDLISPANVDRLADEGGACIVCTHFAVGFVAETGTVNPNFERNIHYLAQKNGWFVPVTPLLDHLAKHQGTDDPGYLYRLGLNVRWAAQRLAKWRRYGRRCAPAAPRQA